MADLAEVAEWHFAHRAHFEVGAPVAVAGCVGPVEQHSAAELVALVELAGLGLGLGLELGLEPEPGPGLGPEPVQLAALRRAAVVAGYSGVVRVTSAVAAAFAAYSPVASPDSAWRPCALRLRLAFRSGERQRDRRAAAVVAVAADVGVGLAVLVVLAAETSCAV